MEIDSEQQDRNALLMAGAIMPPPSHIEIPFDTKMKVSCGAESKSIKDKSIGRTMLQWKLKVRPLKPLQKMKQIF
jgi:hypothetical protein